MWDAHGKEYHIFNCPTCAKHYNDKTSLSNRLLSCYGIIAKLL